MVAYELKFRAHFGFTTEISSITTIDNQLEAYRVALSEAQAKGDLAIVRKIDQQIQELQDFQQRHSEAANTPSPFQVFCDPNPSDINCRVYDE